MTYKHSQDLLASSLAAYSILLPRYQQFVETSMPLSRNQKAVRLIPQFQLAILEQVLPNWEQTLEENDLIPLFNNGSVQLPLRLNTPWMLRGTPSLQSLVSLCGSLLSLSSNVFFIITPYPLSTVIYSLYRGGCQL
jgi:hypothetical protein